jgi:23S rRNA-/tRNA-specific pseudouridylate synthase
VLAQTEDIVAVHKPACMPVHTAGQYRKNTVLSVLQATRPELLPLSVTHRLDRPVSGLLLLARSTAAANKMRALLEVRGAGACLCAPWAASGPASARQPPLLR